MEKKVKEGRFSFSREYIEKRASGALICVRGGEDSADVICRACHRKVANPDAMRSAAEKAVEASKAELAAKVAEKKEKSTDHKFYVDFRTGKIFLRDGRVAVVDVKVIQAWETTDRIDECPVMKIAEAEKSPHEKDEGHPEYSACSECKSEGGYDLIRGIKAISRNIKERAEFDEAVRVVGGLLKEGKTEDEAEEQLTFLYPGMPTRVEKKVLATGLKRFRKDRWNAAVAAVEAYYADSPNTPDVSRPPLVASRIFADPEVAAATTHGMLTAAVAAKQEEPAVAEAAKKAKDHAFEACEIAVNRWYEGHPNDRRHPAKVAEDITSAFRMEDLGGKERDLPLKMLTKAAFNHQDKVRQAERRRLAGGWCGKSAKKKKPEKNWKQYAPKSSGFGTLAETAK